MYLDPGKAAFIYAQTTLMNAELQGMIAENQYNLNCGNSIAYREDAFIKLREKYESIIGYNAIIEFSHQ